MITELPPSLDIESWSLAAQMRSMAVPALLMLVAAFVWLKVCQRICRAWDARFDAHLAALDNASKSMTAALMARAHVGRGKPSDRLFFAGLGLAALIALAVLFGLLILR